jgi:hypothetical protein
MATLGTTAFVAYLGLRGDGKEKTTPPIQASSGDEEKFIRCVSHCSVGVQRSVPIFRDRAGALYGRRERSRLEVGVRTRADRSLGSSWRKPRRRRRLSTKLMFFGGLLSGFQPVY